ncbi:MAG: AAA family ATPase [Clostridia bacterium]|nr:AAA family ATPase [Clostridia bacterium]
MNITHEDETKELQKLNKTQRFIDNEIKESEERLERGFEDYDFDDYADDFMKAALKEKFNQRIKNLKMVRQKPYFARVDFVEDGEEKRDAFYLGKVMVTDHDTLEQIVIDWRAPIADLYYEGRLGEATYKCPAGEIKGEIKLKRQYFFDDKGLADVMDIDITTNDEMLQPFLSANSDTRLKNIISTIQAEQNRIIRSDMWQPLVVQGVAGSGKTTIALHRIAYLIYNYDKNFFPEEFLIIAPNKFFLNYISNVLPDLGVDRVGQSTYEEIAFEVIGSKFEIEEPNEKLARIINNNKSEKEEKACKIIEEASIFKSSIRYKNVIDDYIYEIEKRMLPEDDFRIGKYIFMTKQEIAHLYYREYGNLPICRRIEEISKHLKNSVTMRNGVIIKDIEEDRDYKVAKIKQEEDNEQIRLAMIRDVYDEADQMKKTVTKDVQKYVQKFFSNQKVLEPIKYYREFIDYYLEEFASQRIPKEQIAYIKNSFDKSQRTGKIEMEDIAPLMYLKYMIHGVKTKFDLKHIVIDEAQDFSEFQFYIFKKIVKSNSLTILGDLSQGIYYYRGTQNWQKTMSTVFGVDNEPQYLTLKKTYRTTEEIMNVANQIISHITDKLNCALGEPVMKNGEPVTIKEFGTEQEMYETIKERIKKLKSRNLKNIALIGKTVDDCKEIANAMSDFNENEIHIISDKDSEYNGGISIVPSYLSKGLEFDAVIVTNADVHNYTDSEVDTKLLYVCATRAMNTLDIYHVEPLTCLLK